MKKILEQITDWEKVKENPIELKYIKNQTEEMCLMAVKKDGFALQGVKVQTPKICLEAVKQNGYALDYVEKQTEEICLEAVKKTGSALQFVEKQTPEICLEAVKERPWALQLVKEQTEEICFEVMRKDIKNIVYLKEKEKIKINKKFGTYSGELCLYKSKYGKVIHVGCWFGGLEEFKTKVWERFEYGFKNQTKEDVEDIIKKLEEVWRKDEKND